MACTEFFFPQAIFPLRTRNSGLIFGGIGHLQLPLISDRAQCVLSDDDIYSRGTTCPEVASEFRSLETQRAWFPGVTPARSAS